MSRQDTIAAIKRFSELDIDEDDDVALAHEVISTFEDIRNDSIAHNRAVRFLSACLSRYLWTWESLGCETPGPVTAADAVTHWLRTGQFVDGFAALCLPVVPIRNGTPVEDCDEPALRDLSGASSRLAYFCATRTATDAALVLVNLFWADAEGLESNDGEDFSTWLATTGVAIGWDDEAVG